MNHDENNPDLRTWIEPELEARLVAAVLGEASAFETAELERLIAEKPELAIFKRRIEAVHGLIGRATRPDQAPMRLAPERRAKILQTIGAPKTPSTTGDTEAPAVFSLAATRRAQQRAWIWRLSIAACLTLCVAITIKILPSYEGRHRFSESQEPVASRVLEFPAVREQLSVRASAEQEAQQKKKVEAAFNLEKARKESLVRGILPTDVKADPDLSSVIEQRRADRLAGRPASPLPPPASTPTVIAGSNGTALNYSAPAENLAPGGIQDRFGANPANPTTQGGAKQTLTFGGGGGRGAAPPRQTAARAGETFSDAVGLAAARPDLIPTIAQAKKSDEQAITLSPFEVSTSKDVGYAAGNTISGARMDTRLATTPGSISVMTKEFMSDFGISNTSTDKNAGSWSIGFDLGTTTKGPTSPSMSSLADRYDRNDVTIDSFKLVSPPSAAEAKSRLPEDAPAAKRVAPPPPTRTETSTAVEPVSTFSLHVSDVSFRLAQAALARGEKPDPAAIRAEEFYNAFDYGDPTPTTAEKIACRIEQAAHPLLQQRNLVRIAMKVPATGRGAGQPLHLTLLLDTSGSMEREDRAASVRRALTVLASLLGPNDRVTLIGFAQQPRLIVEQLPGDQAGRLAALAANTPFVGGTNMEEALKLAGELARRHRDPAAQNRIVLVTDGAANLGNADPAQLTTMVEALRQQGVAFDACGVGTDGLDDAVLEALTRKGDGRYYVLDRPEDADAGFARQLAGAFRPAAENVKVQVRFNPARVGRYRLLGFEQHRLREEDFRNDKVDAAELAAEEAAVAVYQVEVLPQGEGELGDVFVRFRDTATGEMVERSWTMLHDPRAPAFDRATPTLQLAGTAALLAEKLGGGDAANLVDLAQLAPVVNRLRGQFANESRVQALVTMFEQMRRMSGK